MSTNPGAGCVTLTADFLAACRWLSPTPGGGALPGGIAVSGSFYTAGQGKGAAAGVRRHVPPSGLGARRPSAARRGWQQPPGSGVSSPVVGSGRVLGPTTYGRITREPSGLL